MVGLEYRTRAFEHSVPPIRYAEFREPSATRGSAYSVHLDDRHTRPRLYCLFSLEKMQQGKNSKSGQKFDAGRQHNHPDDRAGASKCSIRKRLIHRFAPSDCYLVSTGPRIRSASSRYGSRESRFSSMSRTSGTATPTKRSN